MCKEIGECRAITLTTGVDTPASTIGNDTYNGVADSAATTTFTNLDVIDGGAGTDTLNLTNASGTMSLNTGLTVKNIEIVNLRSAQNAVTADVQGYTGLTTLNLEELGTAANATVNTKSNATAVTVNKVDNATITDNGTGTGATKDVLATVSVTGAATSVTVNSDALTSLILANSAVGATVNAAAGTRVLGLTVDKLTAGTIADASATGLTVAAANNASAGITLTAGNAGTIAFSGDKTISTALGAQKANLAITSTNTAGVTITTALNPDVTFTGGDGKDTITLAGSTTKAINLGAGDDKVTVSAAVATGGSINGGDGIDTLSMSAADANTLSGTTTFKAGFSNFEKIGVGQVGAFSTSNVNMSNLNDINYVVSAGTATGTGTNETDTITFNGLLSGQSVTVGGVTVIAPSGGLTANAVAALYQATPPAGYNATVANNVVTLTATSVGDKGDLTGSVANAAAPTAPTAVTTQGIPAVAGSTETAVVNFQGLIAGESVTVDGRTVTATPITEKDVITFGALAAGQALTIGGMTVTSAAGAATAAQIAQTFATGTAAVADLNVSGTAGIAGYTNAGVVGSTVTFMSTTASTNVPDLVASGTGIGAVTSLVTTQGNIGNLTAAQVATAMSSAGPNTAAAVVSGGLTNYAVGTAAGNAVTFTSTTPNVNVSPDLTATTTAGTAPVVVVTQGVTAVTGVTESAVVMFSALKDGQSETIAGRTVTASGADLSAAQVADGFFNGVVAGNVVVSGTLAGWTLTNPVANDAFVTFTSTTANSNVTDVSLSATSAAAAAPTPAGISIVNGSATGGGGSLNVTNMANNGTFELTSAINGASSVVMKDATGSADVLNIKLNGAANIVNTDVLTVAGVETINITATDSSSDTVTLTNPAAASTIRLNAAAATSIVVTGNHGVSFSFSNLPNVTSLDASGVVSVGDAAGASATQVGATGAVTFTSQVTNKSITVTTGNGADVINLSSMTDGTKTTTATLGDGNDTFTGSAGVDTVNMGAGADTYYSSAKADVITLGAGNDTYVLRNATDSVLAAADTITDFSANTYGQGTNGAANQSGATGVLTSRTGDVIDLSLVNGIHAIRVGVQSNAADAQTFIQNGTTDGLARVNVALDSSSGKVYIDLNDDGAIDSVIALTGVTTLNEAAFVA